MIDEPDEMPREPDAADRARHCGEDVTAITLAYVKAGKSDAERIVAADCAAIAAVGINVIEAARQLGAAPDEDMIDAVLGKLSASVEAWLADPERAARLTPQ